MIKGYKKHFSSLIEQLNSNLFLSRFQISKKFTDSNSTLGKQTHRSFFLFDFPTCCRDKAKRKEKSSQTMLKTNIFQCLKSEEVKIYR